MNAVIDIDNKLCNLETANENFKSIIIKPNNEKFDYLDSWLLKTSDEFKKENENRNKKIYPRFNYGTIVKVDFGINQGAELSGPHFAICMDKYDNAQNETLTIIPLTSKGKGKRIALGKLIFQEYEKNVQNELNKLEKKLKYSKKNDNKENINKTLIEISKVNRIKKYCLKYEKIHMQTLVKLKQLAKIN